jgi:hypothetical protein
MVKYSTLSDSVLDSGFESAWKAAQLAVGKAKFPLVDVYVAMGSEILERLGGVWGFTTGIFGYTRFPKFDAIQKVMPGGFSQSTESQDVVVTNVKDKAESLVSGLKYGAVAIGGLGLIAAFLFFRGRK